MIIFGNRARSNNTGWQIKQSLFPLSIASLHSISTSMNRTQAALFAHRYDLT
jgi:hypothetical protein